MDTIQISHARVLYFNYYEKDKLLLQENMQKKDKYEIQYFLQAPGHIKCS